MQARVKLPPDSLIHYLHFCRLIAAAICPIDKTPRGINCVIGKIFPSDISDPDLCEGVVYPLYPIDKDDFTKALKKLPDLNFPMSEKDLEVFFLEYKSLKERPKWMPVLVTEDTIIARKIENNQVFERHLRAIRNERKSGRLAVVNASHVPW